MTTKGHCLCKKTTWEYAGEQTWACYCHCDACRRNCAAPVVAWLGVPLKISNGQVMYPRPMQAPPACLGIFAILVARLWHLRRTTMRVV